MKQEYTGLSHHLGPLDVTDAEDDLGDGVGADQLHQDHVGAVAHLRLHRRQLHHLEGGRQRSCRLERRYVTTIATNTLVNFEISF